MNAAGWAGRALQALAVVFLAADAAGKLAQIPQVLEATAELGFPLPLARPLGAILLVSALLYAVPRTALWGAICITAYLGGAVASHLRIGSPLASHVLFPVYVGCVVWAGLALRSPALAGLLLRGPKTPPAAPP